MEQTDSPKLRRESIIFFVTTIFVTWLVWFPALLIQKYGVSMRLPYHFFITVGTFVPSTAGFFFAYLFGGKAEVLSLIKSLLNVHIRFRWLAFIFFVLPAVSAVSCLIYYLSAGNLPPMEFPLWFVPIAFIYILIFMGPLGEEAGWRGFALKRMLGHLSPFKAAVLLGIIWSFWHLPLFFINGTTQNALISFGSIPAILGYSLYTVMISVLVTLVYLQTCGSVFGSILLHTVRNLSLGVVPVVLTKYGTVMVLAALCIAVTMMTYKYRKMMFRKCK